MTAKEYVKQQLSERLEQFRSEGIELVGTLHAAVFTAKDLEQAFEAGKKEAQPKWIPCSIKPTDVEERKYKGDYYGLVYACNTFIKGDGHFMTSDFFDQNSGLWSCCGHYATHWMPLPVPPEEGGEE